MKKIVVASAIFMLLCVAPVCAYAGPHNSPVGQTTKEETLPSVSFSVTSGMKTDKKTESTFDDSRTISGSADQGAAIAIDVYTKDASGELVVSSNYSIEVGASGLFSQTIDLELGENVVTVTAEKDGYSSVCEEATIKRKKRDIKKELESGISIPGSSTNTGKMDLLLFR